MNLPKTLNFGGGELVEISYLQDVFKISRRTAMDYLRALHIDPIYIGRDVYFSLPTLKRIFFVLSRPGSPGFVFPGSRQKNNRLYKEGGFLAEVTPDIVEQAADPKILVEMAACEGRNPNAMSQIMKQPVGRPAKKKSNTDKQEESR